MTNSAFCFCLPTWHYLFFLKPWPFVHLANQSSWFTNSYPLYYNLIKVWLNTCKLRHHNLYFLFTKPLATYFTMTSSKHGLTSAYHGTITSRNNKRSASSNTSSVFVFPLEPLPSKTYCNRVLVYTTDTGVSISTLRKVKINKRGGAKINTCDQNEGATLRSTMDRYDPHTIRTDGKQVHIHTSASSSAVAAGGLRKTPGGAGRWELARCWAPRTSPAPPSLSAHPFCLLRLRQHASNILGTHSFYF